MSGASVPSCAPPRAGGAGLLPGEAGQRFQRHRGGISGLARDLTRCGCANINVLVLSGCADLFFGGAQAVNRKPEQADRFFLYPH